MTSLSILIPAYNEQGRLPSTLDKVAGFLSRRNYEFAEVLVIDDGSTDGTADLVRRRATDWGALRLLQNPGNRGKGYSVRYGMKEARGAWILFTDADLSTPIEDIDALCKATREYGAEIAIGSRAVSGAQVGVRQPFAREMSGRFFNRVVRALTALPYADTQCGFKLFSAHACNIIAERQRMDRFSFDVEMLYIAHRHGLKVCEVPVRWNNVKDTRVTLIDGLSALKDIWRIRSNARQGLYS